METTINEVADGVYRVSTFVADVGLGFNQILLDAEEPLLFHTGMRGLFPAVSEAVATVMPLDQLRWISFGHVEADECGSLNSWLAAAPSAQVAFGGLGCMVSVADLADRPPRPMDDGEVLDLGGKRVRYLATPHVPHGWEAGLLYEETTSTLLCGDLFTSPGPSAPLSTDSPMEAAAAGEDAFGYSSLAPGTAAIVRRLAALEPERLALMHGPTHQGPAGVWLEELACSYERRTEIAVPAAAG